MRRIAPLVVALAAAVLPLSVSGPAGATPGPVATPLTTLDAGEGFRCGVTSTGGVSCWGADDEGRLGRGAIGANALVPGAVTGLPAGGAVAVTTGWGHACALIGEGSGDVWCWGKDADGQTGIATGGSGQPTPALVASLPDIVSVSAGGAHTCAVSELGDVWCWGQDFWGQVQPGGTSTTSATPVKVAGLPKVDRVAAGYDYTCARGVDGSVWCWGNNGEGQLGFGTVGDADLGPSQVSGIGAAVRSLDAGAASTCALTVAGGVRCWGNNAAYQLGNGTTTGGIAPVTPTGLGSGVREVDAGTDASCAVLTTGALRCWGQNFGGDVGTAGRAPAPTPAAASGLTGGVRDVAAGDYGTCALLASGSARCFGQPYSGELGNGTDAALRTPTAITPTGAAKVAVSDTSTCIVRSAGGLRCIGSNWAYQLGNGAAETATSLAGATPTGTTGAVGVDVGQGHACEVEGDGQVRCWGLNGYGQVSGATNPVTAPQLVTGVGGDAVSIATGDRHTCAARPTGVKCWGDNADGQLGTGNQTASSSPVAVTNLSEDVVEVTAGRSHTCVRISDGSLRCWGRNNGALGNGTNSSRSTTPVAPIGIASGATSVAAGDTHTCAAVNGAVKCWGANGNFQTGYTTSTATQTSPYAVPSLTSGWVEVAAGGDTSCARNTTGRVVCWGANDYQVADTSTSSSVGTPVERIASGAVDIDLGSGGDTACAVKGDGSTVCWGLTDEGQGGQGPGWVPTAVTGGSAFRSGQPYAPFASWNALVDQQYLDLLGRSPASSERSAAVNGLTAATTTPGDLLAAMRNDVDQTGAVDPTTRLYFAYFLRTPDKTGLEYWIRKKRGGTLLRSISDSFATSSEFTRRYGSLTNQEFVELIYQNLFAREGDASGVDYWTRKLDTKAESRGGVMAQFSESSEYKRKMSTKVTVSIFDLLVQKRQPPQAEFDAEVARIDGGALTVATFANE
ncbi:MAG: DUF4214 domain-containing protein, partial [Acidimicrobiales bacterium]